MAGGETANNIREPMNVLPLVKGSVQTSFLHKKTLHIYRHALPSK